MGPRTELCDGLCDRALSGHVLLDATSDPPGRLLCSDRPARIPRLGGGLLHPQALPGGSNDLRRSCPAHRSGRDAYSRARLPDGCDADRAILAGRGVFLAYYRARGRVLPHAAAPATVREAALVPRDARLPGGWVLQLPPFALLAATAIWLHLHWGQIPEVFPVHWRANGQVDNWATRSFAGVYSPLLIGTVLCALMGFSAYAMLRWSRLIRVGGAAGEGERRFRRVVVSILVATEYFIALVFMWTGLLPLSHKQTGPPGFIPMLVFALAFTVVTVALMIWVGQGGTRLVGSAAAASGGVAPVGDRTSDKYWKLGLIYINRSDPALFVEKRFGIGYTLNFGHPGVWIFLAALVAVVVAIIFVVPSHHHP